MLQFNPLVARLAPPPIPAVQSWGRAYDGRHGPPIDLSQAVPGYPPHARLLEWLAEAAGSPGFAGYGPIEGEPELRQAYSHDVAEVYGSDVSAADIHITSGCNQAFVAVMMALAGAGDRVLMTNPCYFNHETSLAMLGIGVDYVGCSAADGFVPRPAAVAEALARTGARALTLVSPNNPTGAIYPPELLAELHGICRDAGAWLVLDETYRDFLPPGSGAPHGLLRDRRWRESFVQLYSFSKSFCIPGHRLGAVTAGAELVEAVAKVMDNLQICAPRAPQAAVARALPALGEWRMANRREIAHRASVLREVMNSVQGWTLESLGAYFAFLRHPFGELDSRAVAERLAREAGVVTLPGEYFGPGQKAFLRIAFANAESSVLRGLPERLTLIG